MRLVPIPTECLFGASTAAPLLLFIRIHDAAGTRRIIPTYFVLGASQVEPSAKVTEST